MNKITYIGTHKSFMNYMYWVLHPIIMNQELVPIQTKVKIKYLISY